MKKGERRHVLVCGGQDYDNEDQLNDVLDAVKDKARRGVTLVHGGFDGAEALAAAWADDRGVPVIVIEGEGPYGNQRRIDEGKPWVVIAFPGGGGTADLVRRARAADILVIEV